MDPAAISSLLLVHHAASLGLHLGSSAQVLLAGFPHLPKCPIISWPGIKLREERISVVDMETGYYPDPSSWKDLLSSFRE